MKEILDLHAFVDGELTPEESKSIRTLLEQNPEASAEVSAISNLVDFMRQKSATHPSEESWKVCVGRLNELDRSKKIEGFLGRYAWALCTCLFILVIGGRWAVKDVRGESERTAEFFSVFHSSSQTVSPQTERMYSDLFRRSKEAQSGVRFVGSAIGKIMDVDVERIDLVDKQGPLTYFVIHDVINFEDASQLSDDPGVAGGLISSPNESGKAAMNCVIWVDNGRTYVLCARRSVAGLANAAVQTGLRSGIN